MTTHTDNPLPGATRDYLDPQDSLAEVLARAMELDKQKDAEIARLREETAELKKNLDNTAGWFSAYQDLENWMLREGLWGDQDIKDDNPAHTLIAGLKRNLKRIREEAATDAIARKQATLKADANAERDVLVKAIHDTAFKIGLAPEEELPTYGPYLLSFCDEIANTFLKQVASTRAAQEQLAEQQQLVAATSRLMANTTTLISRALKHHTCNTVPLSYERYGSLDAQKAEGRALWEKDIPAFLNDQANGAKRAREQFEKSRAAYKQWLDTQPEDAFAPATHEEVMALYDKNCKPLEGAPQ